LPVGVLRRKGLNPKRKQAVPVGQLSLDEWSGAKLTQAERKTSALIPYEPLKTLKYWLTPLKMTDPDFGTLTYIYMSKSTSQIAQRPEWECESHSRALALSW
jgi:hypothetical protein